jgi:hypothetical protein
MRTLHCIIRTRNYPSTPEEVQREVCVGSSPLSGKPYWAKPGEESTMQPLLLRSYHYAMWCKDIAMRKDIEAEGKGEWVYDVMPVEFPF